VSDPLYTLTHRFGFTTQERRAIAKWWSDSGQERWDKHAEQTSPASHVEIVEFITACVRGNLQMLVEEMQTAPPKPKIKVRVKKRMTC
jgi:hypothetical protein